MTNLDLYYLRRRAGCIVITVMMLAVIFLAARGCRAEEVDIQKLATAIYHAEGGSRTSHPYGILAHYKTTTPRQACVNTIRHALKDWNGKGDFLRFLQKRYAPVGATNDPTNLNANWYINVKKLYAQEGN